MAEENKPEPSPNAFIARTADNGTMFLQNFLNIIFGSYHYYAGLYEGAGMPKKAKALRDFVEQVADANWRLLDELRKEVTAETAESVQKLAEELKNRPAGKKD